MPMVTCPFCKEEGRIPKTFIGKQIKCSKCKNHFVVTAPPAKAAVAAAPGADAKAVAAAAASTPRQESDEIAIEGMDGSSWESLAVSPAVETSGSPMASDGTFTAAPSDAAAPAMMTAQAAAPVSSGTRQYKLLTQKDKFFEGKFELPKLEDAVNHYARDGWCVKAMTSALVHGFSGGPREEIVILLER